MLGLKTQSNDKPIQINPYEMPEEYAGKIAATDKLVADPASGALKADGNKLRYDLIPVRPLEDLVKILTFGAQKYEARNWEKGMQWSRPFAAAMRHLWLWWRGESVDPESGCSHLAHAACNLFFLMEYEYTAIELDDRPKKRKTC